MLELQQEVEYQNTLLTDRTNEVETLSKTQQSMKAQMTTREQQYADLKQRYSAETSSLQASLDAWTKKYATHKAKVRLFVCFFECWCFACVCPQSQYQLLLLFMEMQSLQEFI
mgnify:CR=1 FL=1